MGNDNSPPWNWPKHRAALLLLARGLLREKPDVRRRVSEAELVQQTLVQAQRGSEQCHASTDAGRLRWLRVVLVEQFRQALACETAGQHDATIDQVLDELGSESSDRLENFLQSAERQATAGERGLDAAEALFELPATEREVVIAHDLEGKTLRELAVELGVGKEDVARLLAAGRLRLRDLVAGRS